MARDGNDRAARELFALNDELASEKP